tara:strand:- start:3385 stop:3636 length:252 start_codon:yes stop_codon:yes gene_type:complete
MRRTNFDDSRELQAQPQWEKPENKPMACPRCQRMTTWGVLAEFGARCGPCFDAYRSEPLETARTVTERIEAKRAERQRQKEAA